MSDHTVVSGSATNAQHGIDCASCGNANPFGMRFCLNCGRPALYSQMTEKKVGPCPLCGCADPLNQAFCIACGTALVGEGSPAAGGTKKRTGTIISSVVDSSKSEKAAQTTVKHKTGFSWEPPGNNKSVLPGESNVRPVKRVAPSKKDRSMVFASVVGLIFGVLIALALSTTEPIKYAFERLHWPAGGLVVYATPARAKVVLENIDTRVITLAQTESDGSLKMTSAQPGHYRLFLQAPADDDCTFADVTILPNRPTVVGFPAPILLVSATH